MINPDCPCTLSERQCYECAELQAEYEAYLTEQVEAYTAYIAEQVKDELPF